MNITTNDDDKMAFMQFLEERLESKGYTADVELTVMPFFGKEPSISIFDAMIRVEDRWVLNLNFTCGGVLVKDENNRSLIRFELNAADGFDFIVGYLETYFDRLAKGIA